MQKIHEGQMLVRTKAILPDKLSLHGTSLTPAWLLLDEDASRLGECVTAAEWHLFVVPQRSRGWALAFNEEDALEGSLCRAVNKVGQRHNAVEITRIREQRILGMYFCRIEVSNRHIQKGAILGFWEREERISPAAILTARPGGKWKREGGAAA